MVDELEGRGRDGKCFDGSVAGEVEDIMERKIAT
jgi:hypothetical protein